MKTSTQKQEISDLFEKQRQQSFLLRSQPIAFRKEKLKRLLKWVLLNRHQIHEALRDDLGRSATDTDIVEVFPVTKEIRLALRHLNEWTRDLSVNSGLLYIGTTSHIKYEPKGVCLIIAPWNFPFNLVLVPLISALAAGNTVILKPSEYTPATSRLIKHMTEACFVKEEVAVVEGAVTETQILLSLPFNHIFFTGSTAVGKIIMASASKHLASITLELGGKSPVIVDETADIHDAARKIVWGRFVNCSQTCLSPDYILAHENIKEELIQALIAHTKSIFDSKGGGFDQTHDYSRLIHERHTSRLVELMNEAVALGAKIKFGGKYQISSRFFEPTILCDVDVKTRIWNEEIFGPVLPINGYSDLNNAIEHINLQPKPLSIYLFSRSKAVQRSVERLTSSGSLVINDVVLQYSHPNLPFGGVNHSGIGKSHGFAGFKDFSNEKSVLRQRIGITNAMPFYPPFSSWKKKLVDLAIKYF